MQLFAISFAVTKALLGLESGKLFSLLAIVNTNDIPVMSGIVLVDLNVDEVHVLDMFKRAGDMLSAVLISLGLEESSVSNDGFARSGINLPFAGAGKDSSGAVEELVVGAATILLGLAGRPPASRCPWSD